MANYSTIELVSETTQKGNGGLLKGVNRSSEMIYYSTLTYVCCVNETRV